MALIAASGAVDCSAAKPGLVRIAFITNQSPGGASNTFERLRTELSKIGLLEGRDVRMTFHSAPPETPQIRAEVDRLAAGGYDVIFTPTTYVASLLLGRTSTPVVFTGYSDPVADGLVESWSRPGGNITGVTGYLDLGAKRLEILKEAFPAIRRVGILVDRGLPRAGLPLDGWKAGAAKLGLELLVFPVDLGADPSAAFAGMKRSRVDALLIAIQDVVLRNPSAIARYLDATGMPAIAERSDLVLGKAVLSHEVDLSFRIPAAARIIARILQGESPGVIPIERPVRFRSILNPVALAHVRIPFDKAVLKQVEVRHDNDDAGESRFPHP